MTTKQSRISQALADAGQSPPQDPQPAPDGGKRRRSPTDVQRDRLTERIARLENDRDEVVRVSVQQIRENADSELRERIARVKDRVTARYADRIAPLQTMLDALGKNGAGQ